MATNDVTAVQTRSTFRFRCSVFTEIQAPPEEVWALLTRTDGMVRWNSTLTSIEGDIELGGTVRMRVPEAPGKTFKVKVTRFEPNREMIWRQGNPALFLGVRTYQLTPSPDGSSTGFRMTEEFSGPLLPFVAGRLPDFGPIFDRYATDLKSKSEQ